MDLEILFDDSNYISLETYSLSFKKCVKKLYMKSVHLWKSSRTITEYSQPYAALTVM